MRASGGFGPGKGSRWIAERILAAYERSGRDAAPGVPRLSGREIDDFISRTLEEELARLGSSSPAPPPRAGEG